MDVTLLEEAKMQSFFMRDLSFSTLFYSHLNKHLINAHLAITEISCLKSRFMGHLSKHSVFIVENFISFHFTCLLNA